MSKYIRAKITKNAPVNKNHNLIVLNSDDIPQRPLPGQFYMIGTDFSYDPLLKRPFSIFRYNHPSPPPESFRDKGGMVMTRRGGFSGELQFLYRIKGKGTERMKEMKKGDTVTLIGPLGNGYPMPGKNLTPVLVAGGIGIASLFPLAEKLSGNVHLFYGARTSNELLMLNELKGIVRKELIISTDDGSEGRKGTVVDVLKRFLASKLSAISYQLIYACGPSPMLEAVSKFAAEKGVKGYISMEENMACGVGACLGCAIRVKESKGQEKNSELKTQTSKVIYKRVCKEGPVFSIEEIVW